MLRLFSLLLIVPTSLFAASEGLRVVYEIEMPGHAGQKEPVKMKGKYYIQEGAVRFETENPNSPFGNTIVISTAKPKRSIILMPKQKMYTELPTENAEAVQKEAVNPTPFKSMGKSKEIAGYSCSMVMREVEDRREEACTSEKLAKDLKNLESVLPRNKSSEGGMPKGMGGLPLEYQVFRNVKGTAGQQGMSMRVEEIKREKFASALFEVPSDYKKQEMPRIDPKMIKEMQKSQGQQKMPEGFEEKLKEMKKMMEEQQKLQQKPSE